MKNKAKKPIGRPRIKIDYKLVDNLCAMWCTGEEIASALNIDYDTLNRALKREKKMGFAEYYKKKSAMGNMSLRRAQYNKAITERNTTMQIFLGKVQLGQREDEIQDNSNEAPQPLKIEFKVADPIKEVKITNART